MAEQRVQAVDVFGEHLTDLLQRAEEVKPTSTVEPSLSKPDFADLFDRVESTFFATANIPELRKRSYPAIETAIRDACNNILASTTITEPSFVRIWNLFDIISFLSDNEQCDPALLFWLVEELLDSQTIAGCRKIFDYLESRRERITAKNFGSWNLVILRTCNELLRRLSRAEDTAFCGRVFIFMFQSYPLGDKSSVNLRGEYHTENVTTYDELAPKEPKTATDSENMDVDSEQKLLPAAPKTLSNGASTVGTPSHDSSSSTKGVSFSKPDSKEMPLSPDELYTIFWSLQECFNQPKKLFDPIKFAEFKKGLETTMVTFKTVQSELGGRPVKVVDEGKRGSKRKRSQGEDDLANSYNPKYLTSRDLFELEISDLSFRRHILVQVLIVMDFLLSLSAKAKEKLAQSMPEIQNRSVMYADRSLNEEDTKWALDMKRSIAEYLKQGFEGAFFYRMVETVLSRDKNWVRWKIANCPSIAKAAVTPEDYGLAKASARKVTTNKKIRPIPLGSLDLKFLAETDDRSGLERLKNPLRYQLPSVKSFKGKIDMDDFNIEMENDPEKRSAVVDSKASKSWRALRIASTAKLVSFDKIENADKIEPIFEDDIKAEDMANGDEEGNDGEPSRPLKDRRPIVISGPSGVGKGTLVEKLLANCSNVFSTKASHTTRPCREGEREGIDKFFVTKEKFDMLRDGDEFLEFNNFSGYDYGTSRKVVEAIVAKGQVPLIEAEYNGIQQLKDNGFTARFIFIQPPDMTILEDRLRRRGSNDEENTKSRLEIAKKELAHADLEGFYDKVFVNDDLEATYAALEKYIFGDEEVAAEATSMEVVMEDDGTEVAALPTPPTDSVAGSADGPAAPDLISNAAEATEV